MIPKETVDLILDTARVEEVVGDFVTLKRRGSSYVACCPFHNEKTPSFHVTPSKGIYKRGVQSSQNMGCEKEEYTGSLPREALVSLQGRC